MPSLKQETFIHNHLSSQTKQIALVKHGTSGSEKVYKGNSIFQSHQSCQQERRHNYLWWEKNSSVREEFIGPWGIANAYVWLQTKLNDQFTLKKNKHHAKYLFLKLRLHAHRKNNRHKRTCAARLCEEAKECEFGSIYDERILEHSIQTIEPLISRRSK